MINECKYVAVYGSLREGLSNHSVLGDSKLVTKGVINDTTLYPYFGTAFPAMTFNGNNHTVVEVYEIADEETAQRLDWLEGYPSFYDRKIVEVCNRYNQKIGEAWVYFIDGDEDLTKQHPVLGGDWMAFKTGEATVL